MIKNMTRKGLAIGATAALTLAGLVGFAAPAQATTVLLAPSVGTEYAVPLGETFILETRRGDGTNPFNDDMTVTVIDSDQLLDTVGVSTLANGSGATPIARGTGANVTKFEGDVTAPGVGVRNYIVLTPKTTATATFSVRVTVSFDGGATSPERTVTFHRAADYTWNLSFTTPVVGDAKLGAVVSTTPQLNLAQFASKLQVGFATVASNGNLTTAVGSATTISSTVTRFASGTAASVTTDVTRETNGSYKWAVSVVDAVTPANKVKSANTYAAQIIFGTTEVGTRQVIKPAADSITGLTAPALAASANTKGTDIRLATTSVTVETVAYRVWSSTVPDRVFTPAGETVNVTISKGTSFDSKATVAAGGKTLTATTTGDKIEITATVGASGKVSIPVTLTGLLAGDSFKVLVGAQNAILVSTGTSLESTFTVKATAATQLVDHNLVGASAAWKVPHGTYTIRFAVVDNFDQPLAGTGYRVVLHNGRSADDVAQPVVNGVATFSVSTKNSADADVSSFTATLQKADGLGFADDTANSPAAVSLPVVIGASTAAATVTVTDGTTTAATANSFTLPAGSATFPLNLQDMKSANTRLGEAAPTIGFLGTTLSGAVTDANGVGTYSNVTISAPGLMFAATTPGSKTVFSMDSITVQTNATGSYAGVEVYSNKAGKVSVTVTSGSASQAVLLTFAAAAVTTGVTLAIDAPASVQPGSTLVVKATLVDKYGNPVSARAAVGGTANESLIVSYDGPGLPISTPSAFTDGALQFGVLLGANDRGTATVTISVYADTLKITTQKTITIGSVVGTARAWTRDMGDGTIKMYARDVVGAGKVTFYHNGREVAWIRAVDATDPKLNVLSDGMVRTRTLVSGRNVFEIKVNGVQLVRRIATGS